MRCSRITSEIAGIEDYTTFVIRAGVTTAWIGNLAALYPYKWIFFSVTAVFLAGGFYTAYAKPAARDCPPEEACALPVSDRVNRTVLWTATVLVGAALAFPYVTPILLEY